MYQIRPIIVIFFLVCLVINVFGGRRRDNDGDNIYSDNEDGRTDLPWKEGVVRNKNGVLVMKLSPRRRGSLPKDTYDGDVTTSVDIFDGRIKRLQQSAKPAIIFAKKEYNPYFIKSTDALLENQTETEANESQNHNESSQSKQEGDSSSFFSTEVNTSDFDNENESPLSQSALLRNASSSEEKKNAHKNKRPELGQVWSSSTEDGKSAEEGGNNDDKDFQTLIAGFLKREIWTIPLFVFASLNIVLITFFEIYVLCRTKGQSRGHLFLGQMLLLGLFLCSTLALLFAIYPSMFICYFFRIGIGLGYSLIFSVLTVKCMFLLCLDMGLYLPTIYQGTLLFFAVLVQVVLDTQWTLLFPPIFLNADTIREESIFMQCGTSYSLLLYSLWYIGFLLLLAGFLAAKATFRGVAENYRESIYILMSIIVSVPISISWALAGWILEGREQDACVAFGLVAISLAIFLIMFMPKGRQLAAMGKEAAYEDDDQFSRYSPSFFHFKPSNKSCKGAAFGDGNVYTTLEPTLSTINPNVFFHRGEYHSGMIY